MYILQCMYVVRDFRNFIFLYMNVKYVRIKYIIFILLKIKTYEHLISKLINWKFMAVLVLWKFWGIFYVMNLKFYYSAQNYEKMLNTTHFITNFWNSFRYACRKNKEIKYLCAIHTSFWRGITFFLFIQYINNMRDTCM